MAWHVLSSTRFDFERFERESKADSLPRHLLPQIAERLGAEIHQPEPGSGSAIDRFASRLYAQPEHWHLARRVLPLLNNGDAVYTAGCDSGIPVALLCGIRRRSVSMSIAFADPSRLRPKVLGWLLVLLRIRLTILVTTDSQKNVVERSFGRFAQSVHVIEGQTDCNFFRPPEQRRRNSPPLVASCGVEQRDYHTMGAALADCNLEAKVCFVSPNQTGKTRFTLPDPVPDNFEFRHFEFAELRELYQQADAVIVPLIENRYSAGLTTLFESMACGTPVVVTESPGIVARLVDEELVLGVPAGDADAIARAVLQIFDDNPAAMARAEAARAEIINRYSAESFLDRVVSILSEQKHPIATS